MTSELANRNSEGDTATSVSVEPIGVNRLTTLLLLLLSSFSSSFQSQSFALEFLPVRVGFAPLPSCPQI